MYKTKIKFFTRLLFLLTLVVFVVGCSAVSGSSEKKTDSNSKNNSTEKSVNPDEGTPQQGGEAVVAYYSDVSSYDPILSSTGSDQPLLWPVYDTLVTFTTDLELKPGLAESWEIPDNKTIVLHLKEGVTFHDGTTFDAEAVKFNIERFNSDKSMLSDLKSIESVEVVDPVTVKLLLKQPDASILVALTDRGGMMVSPTAVNKDGESYPENPVGAGPYKMAERIPNGEIVFEAFEDYWQEGQPYLDKMTIKIIREENTQINGLKSGEVDLAYGISAGNDSSFESDPNYVVKEMKTLRHRNIYLNTSIAPLDNKAVRLAVLHGINREALVEALNFGRAEPATQSFPKDYWSADKDMKIDYDPERSKQLLKEAGIENVSFTMIAHANAYATRLAEALKSQLEEVGIEVNIQLMEIVASDASFFAEKKEPAYLTSYTGRPDPHMAVQVLFAEDSFYNPGGNSTPEIESLISEAVSIYEQEERAPLYKEISKLAVLEEAMTIPILYEPRISAMKKELKGFEDNMLAKPIFSTIWLEQ